MVEVDPDAPLLEAPLKRPGLAWPLPVDIRLDFLRDRANLGGIGATRQEVMSALVIAAPEEVHALVEMVINYRTSRIRSVLPVEHRELPRYGRGRRAAPGRSE